MEEKSLDQIKQELGEIDFKKENPSTEINHDAKTETRKIVDEVHNQAIIETVKNDKEVQERVLYQAKENIDNTLETLKQETLKEKQQATYDANKEACECFGIEQGVQVWKIKSMRILHDFWFIIYLVFAFFTICPVNVFCKGLKRFIKANWLVVVSGILIYLVLVVGIPFIITYLKTKI